MGKSHHPFGRGVAFDPSNISKDPIFCDITAGYEVAVDSPCLPPNNDCAVLMGAYGQGCDAPVSLLSKRSGLSRE